jgi:hypothetical protein
MGSLPPSGTFEHVPSELCSAHDLQVPLQALSQHTPCAQKPLPHSSAPAQVWPRPLRPHDPLAHTAGAAQSASEAQVALQTAAPHWNGKHELPGGVTQVPVPSHDDAGVKFVVPPGQVESLQPVPSAYF